MVPVQPQRFALTMAPEVLGETEGGADSKDSDELRKIFFDHVKVVNLRTSLWMLLFCKSIPEPLAKGFAEACGQPLPTSLSGLGAETMPFIVGNFSSLKSMEEWRKFKQDMEAANSLEELSSAKKKWKASFDRAQIFSLTLPSISCKLWRLSPPESQSLSNCRRQVRCRHCNELTHLSLEALFKEIKVAKRDVEKAAADLEAAKESRQKRLDAVQKREKQTQESRLKKANRAEAKAAAEKKGKKSGDGAALTGKFAIYATSVTIEPISTASCLDEAFVIYKEGLPVIVKMDTDAMSVARAETQAALQEFGLELARRKVKTPAVSARAVKAANAASGAALLKVLQEKLLALEVRGRCSQSK